MYVILVYDVGQKRNKMILKKCKQYLSHVQKSVFEGTLTEAQLKRLQRELADIIDVREDQICVYCIGSVRYTDKLTIGRYENISRII